jgi:hypothetical protein
MRISQATANKRLYPVCAERGIHWEVQFLAEIDKRYNEIGVEDERQSDETGREP